MLRLDFLKSHEEFASALDLLEDVKNYAFSAVNINLILPSTYMRLEAAVDYLTYNLQNQYIDWESGNVELSKDKFNEIIAVAKDVNIKQVNVKRKMLVYVDMLINYLEAVFMRTKHVLLKKDIDALLEAIKVADDKIDNA